MDKKDKLKALIKSYVREALQEILVEPLLESVNAKPRQIARPKRSALDELYEDEMIEAPRRRAPISEGSTRAAGRKATAAVERALTQKRSGTKQPVEHKSEAQRRAEQIFGHNSPLSKLFEGDAPPLILDEQDPRLGGGFDGNMVGPRIQGDDFDALVSTMSDTWGKLVKSNKKDLSVLNEAARSGSKRVEPAPVFEEEEEDYEDYNSDEMMENEDADNYEDDSYDDDSEDGPTEEEIAEAEAELEREGT